MNSIKDEVRIQASAAKTYEALTKQAGYQSRWQSGAGLPMVSR